MHRSRRGTSVLVHGMKPPRRASRERPECARYAPLGFFSQKMTANGMILAVLVFSFCVHARTQELMFTTGMGVQTSDEYPRFLQEIGQPTAPPPPSPMAPEPPGYGHYGGHSAAPPSSPPSTPPPQHPPPDAPPSPPPLSPPPVAPPPDAPPMPAPAYPPPPAGPPPPGPAPPSPPPPSPLPPSNEPPSYPPSSPAPSPSPPLSPIPPPASPSSPSYAQSPPASPPPPPPPGVPPAYSSPSQMPPSSPPASPPDSPVPPTYAKSPPPASPPPPPPPGVPPAYPSPARMLPSSPPASPPAPPTYTTSTPSPPPPGANHLPPTDLAIDTITSGTPSAANTGMGFPKIRAIGSEEWSFLCGDPWAGWNGNAASVACRQAGYAAGGEPLRVWRKVPLPALLVGVITCGGYEHSLTECIVAPAVGKIDAWTMGVENVSMTPGLCEMQAAVRCRTGAAATASVIVRAATAPPPTNTTGAHPVRVMRLEASVGNGPWGAVCLDDGFDNASAVVACRSLGYKDGGAVYTEGEATGVPNAGAVNIDSAVDAQGSYWGVVSNVRCRGTEASLSSCTGWRSNVGVGVIPCRAAAWVACKLP